MKALIIAILLLAMLKVNAQLIGYYSANQVISKKLTKIELKATISENNIEVLLEVDGSNGDVELKLDEKNIGILKGHLQKGIEWIHKADSANIEVKKSIGKLDCRCNFKFGRFHSGNALVLFDYTRKILSDTILSVVYISTMTTASMNDYIHQTSNIGLNEGNIKSLLELLGEDKILKARTNLKEKKEKQDDILK